jgi:hypothetical protein
MDRIEHEAIIRTFREAARLMNLNTPAGRQSAGWFTAAAEAREKGTPVENEAEVLRMAESAVEILGD